MHRVMIKGPHVPAASMAGLHRSVNTATRPRAAAQVTKTLLSLPSPAPRFPSRRHPRPLSRRMMATTATATTTITNSSPKTTPLGNPLNLPKWLSENSHLLQPPINNYCVYNDPLTVMVVGGPNARTDYHINETPEFFYQYRGRMLLKTVQGGAFVDVYIDEGEIFLLPGNTPHNPVRFADTVGVVIEQPRPEKSVDRLRWYCQACGEQVHEKSFHCIDLGTQLKAAVLDFEADREARTCGKCGELCDVRPSPEVMEGMRTAGL